MSNVITGLSKKTFVNFRNSTLTRILQPFFDGSSRTVMIFCASPAGVNTEITRKTLEIAHNAKLIKIGPKFNPISSKKPKPSSPRQAQSRINVVEKSKMSGRQSKNIANQQIDLDLTSMEEQWEKLQNDHNSVTTDTSFTELEDQKMLEIERQWQMLHTSYDSTNHFQPSIVASNAQMKAAVPEPKNFMPVGSSSNHDKSSLPDLLQDDDINSISSGSDVRLCSDSDDSDPLPPGTLKRDNKSVGEEHSEVTLNEVEDYKEQKYVDNSADKKAEATDTVDYYDEDDEELEFSIEERDDYSRGSYMTEELRFRPMSAIFEEDTVGDSTVYTSSSQAHEKNSIRSLGSISDQPPVLSEKSEENMYSNDLLIGDTNKTEQEKNNVTTNLSGNVSPSSFYLSSDEDEEDALDEEDESSMTEGSVMLKPSEYENIDEKDQRLSVITRSKTPSPQVNANYDISRETANGRLDGRENNDSDDRSTKSMVEDTSYEESGSLIPDKQNLDQEEKESSNEEGKDLVLLEDVASNTVANLLARSDRDSSDIEETISEVNGWKSPVPIDQNHGNAYESTDSKSYEDSENKEVIDMETNGDKYFMEPSRISIQTDHNNDVNDQSEGLQDASNETMEKIIETEISKKEVTHADGVLSIVRNNTSECRTVGEEKADEPDVLQDEFKIEKPTATATVLDDDNTLNSSDVIEKKEDDLEVLEESNNKKSTASTTIVDDENALNSAEDVNGVKEDIPIDGGENIVGFKTFSLDSDDDSRRYDGASREKEHLHQISMIHDVEHTSKDEDKNSTKMKGKLLIVDETSGSSINDSDTTISDIESISFATSHLESEVMKLKEENQVLMKMITMVRENNNKEFYETENGLSDLSYDSGLVIEEVDSPSDTDAETQNEHNESDHIPFFQKLFKKSGNNAPKEQNGESSTDDQQSPSEVSGGTSYLDSNLHNNVKGVDDTFHKQLKQDQGSCNNDQTSLSDENTENTEIRTASSTKSDSAESQNTQKRLLLKRNLQNSINTFETKMQRTMKQEEIILQRWEDLSGDFRSYRKRWAALLNRRTRSP